MPELGSPAPDFTLVGADADTYTLSDYRGRPVVLAFYRGDDSPTCGRQMIRYAEVYSDIKATGAELLAISHDSPASHYAYGCRLELPFPLLSDEDAFVANMYQVTNRFLGYGRATFVVDGNGILQRAMRPAVSGLLTYTSAEEILTAISETTAG